MQLNPNKSAIDITMRRKKLLEMSSYIQTVDNDVTMILQSLQWDRKHLLEAPPMVVCRHDRNHRMPPDKLEDHEKKCFLRSLGYSEDDELLPEPLDANATTLVTLNKNDIQNILEYAAKVDPAFRKGRGTSKEAHEPLSLARLQHAYSADERRALHDAAVSAAPSCHDLSELALPSGDGDKQNTKPKSRAEIIAELRDMKRRRAKYRGSAKTGNYSDELRSVIATQMEHYSEALGAGSRDNNKSREVNSREKFSDKQIKKEPFESGKEYYTEKEKSLVSSRINYHRGKNDESVHKYKSKNEFRRNDKYKDETRHTQNYRDKIHHSERRDKYEKDIYTNYKRDIGERRYKDDRDRYSSSSKERKDTHEHKSKHRDDYKDYKSSRNSDGYRDKYGRREKYTDEKHKRYYDYNQEYDTTKKRIKLEKD